MNQPIARLRCAALGRAAHHGLLRVQSTSTPRSGDCASSSRARDDAWLRGTGEHHHVLQLTARRAERPGPDHLRGRARRPRSTRPPGGSTPRRPDRRAARAALDQVGGGYGVSFVDPEGRVDRTARRRTGGAEAAAARTPSRSGSPTSCSTPSTSTRAVDVLHARCSGMRVSDWSEHQMAFLRCNTDHHSIAFNQAAWTSVNHVAYEMPTDRPLHARHRPLQAPRHHAAVGARAGTAPATTPSPTSPTRPAWCASTPPTSPRSTRTSGCAGCGAGCPSSPTCGAPPARRRRRSARTWPASPTPARSPTRVATDLNDREAAELRSRTRGHAVGTTAGVRPSSRLRPCGARPGRRDRQRRDRRGGDPGAGPGRGRRRRAGRRRGQPTRCPTARCRRSRVAEALQRCDVLVECAGQVVVAAARRGRSSAPASTCCVSSVGALADPEAAERVLAAGPGRLLITAGAVGGVDLLGQRGGARAAATRCR